MTDPRIISIASTIFALLGAYNMYLGIRRMRDARRIGLRVRWYTQTSLLTGIEYILLTFVFLLSMASQQGLLAPGLRGLLAVVYFALLIPAAVIAGLVIRQTILSARKSRQAGLSAARSTQTLPSTATPHALSRHDQQEQAQRQRQRRKKAAAARRRRAGKA
jgi:hypothetical protein